ncbi:MULTISPECIES: hypothetical protein [unclassified Nocardioides]|nr:MULTISPECIES: hypothetical protein [unclassified Nocardioides]
MNTTVVAFIAVAAAVLVVFLAVWLLDARRAKRVEHDPERTEQSP